MTPDPPTGTKTVALRGGAGAGTRGGLIARSPDMRLLVATLDRLRDSDQPVVIYGETGTGKEMVARIIHAESGRFVGPFRALDCATIPTGLLETELFGAKAGAFTDLPGDRPGLLCQTGGGTLLVDGIQDASSEEQAKLLRVLAEGVIRPVGSETEVRIDVRFLFSSSRDLEEEVKKGRFRRDLLHRIQVVSVRVPPLRERLEDLEGLVRFFLREGNRPVASLGPGVLKRLREMPWPGNVRELKNLIVRLRLEDSDRLSLETLERVTSAPRAPAGISSSLLEIEDLAALRDRIEREYFLHHLHRLGGDMDALRRFLGVSLKYCYRRCQWLGIRLKEERRRARREGED